jgi:hypothetical protein
MTFGGSSNDPAPDDSGDDDVDYLYEKGGIAGIGLVIGGKVGGGFSQPFSDLGTSPVGELELGYLLPFLDRSFEVFASGQYAQPMTDGKNIQDSRLPGPMSYDLKQQQAIITLGLLYRIPLQIPMFRPYLGLGGRSYLMRTTITGKGGTESFGENQETMVSWGFYGALGGELHVGPGAILLEAQIGQAKADGFILRNTNVSALNVALGYRLFI